MNYYIKLIILSFIFIFMDAGWIVLNMNLYGNMVTKIQKSEYVMNTNFPNILYPIVTYIVMLLGLFVICMTFVEVQIQKYKIINKYLVALLAGGFYGVIVNSIFNFTSLVFYKDYSLYVSIIDTCWAFVLYGSVSVLYLLIE